MKFYKYISFSDIPEQAELSLGQKLNNYIDRKIAEHIPKHLHKLTNDAVKDTSKSNYEGQLFKRTKRAIDIKKKKKALKKLAEYTSDANISKLPPAIQSIASSKLGSDFMRKLRLGLNKAYKRAGEDDK